MAIVNQSTLPNITLPVVGTDEYVMCRDGVNLLGVPVTDAANGMPVLKNTAAPNATIPYLHLTATGTETNIDVAVQPKGTGAFSLQVADGVVAGGNKRGANAVDLQTSRTAATQVASGQFSFVAGQNNTASGVGGFVGGRNNTDSGQDSVVLGSGNVNNGTAVFAVNIGKTNTTGGNDGAIAIGIGNTCNGATYWAIGFGNNVTASGGFALGRQNTVSGSSASSLGGITNTASGAFSTTVGGTNATTNGIQGQVAFGHNSPALGRYQTTLTGLFQTTTGTTPARATTDGAAASAANQLVLRNSSVFKFMSRVVAYDITTLDAKEWEISGLIKRGANAAATTLVGTPTVTSQFADTAAAAWAVAVSADTTNGALAVTVTGAGTNQIRWYVEIFAYETGV